MQLTGITIPRLAIPDRLQDESIDQPSTGRAVLITLRSNQQIVAKPTLSLSRETFESGESFSLYLHATRTKRTIVLHHFIGIFSHCSQRHRLKNLVMSQTQRKRFEVILNTKRTPNYDKCRHVLEEYKKTRRRLIISTLIVRTMRSVMYETSRQATSQSLFSVRTYCTRDPNKVHNNS